MKSIFWYINSENKACFLCSRHEDQEINFFGFCHGILCNVCVLDHDSKKKITQICRPQDITSHPKYLMDKLFWASNRNIRPSRKTERDRKQGEDHRLGELLNEFKSAANIFLHRQPKALTISRRSTITIVWCVTVDRLKDSIGSRDSRPSSTRYYGKVSIWICSKEGVRTDIQTKLFTDNKMVRDLRSSS